MPQMNMVQAINDGLRHEMKRDERVVVLGEDVGKVGGVFRVTQGLCDEFGDDRVIDTPLSEGRHHRHRHRHGALRPRARARDPVLRLHLPGLRPDRQRAREVPLPLGRRVPGEAGHSHAGRRRHSRRALPLAVARIALHPRRGAQGRLPVATRTTRRGSSSRRSATPIRSSSSSRSASTARPRATCPRGTTRSISAKAAVVREGKHVTVIAWGAMLYEAIAAADQAAEAGHRVRDHRSAHALAGRHRHDRRERRRRPGASSSSTRRRRRAASAPSSSRSSTRRRSSTSRRRRCASPASTRRSRTRSRWSTCRSRTASFRRSSRRRASEEIIMARWEFKLPDIGEGVTEGEIVALAGEAGRRRQGRPADGRGDDRQGDGDHHVAARRDASSRRAARSARSSRCTRCWSSSSWAKPPARARNGHGATNGVSTAAGNDGARRTRAPPRPPSATSARASRGWAVRTRIGALRAQPAQRAARGRGVGLLQRQAARDPGDAQARARHRRSI